MRKEVGVVLFSTTWPTLSQDIVTLQDGKAEIDFTPTVASAETDAYITVKVIEADDLNLIGQQKEIKIKVLPISGSDDVQIKKVITSVNAEVADGVTVYTNTEDFDLSKLSPSAYVVKDQQDNTKQIPVKGFMAHPRNKKAFIIILDRTNNNFPMTDNARHDLVVTSDAVFENADLDFVLVDANHPKVLEVKALDQLTIEVRYNEPVAADLSDFAADVA